MNYSYKKYIICLLVISMIAGIVFVGNHDSTNAKSKYESSKKSHVVRIGGLNAKEEKDYLENIEKVDVDDADTTFFLKDTEYSEKELKEKSGATSVVKGYFDKYLLHFKSKKDAKKAKHILENDEVNDEICDVKTYSVMDSVDAWKPGKPGATATPVPNDASPVEENGPIYMGFDKIKDKAKEGSEVVVAVIDSGANPDSLYVDDNNNVVRLGDRLDSRSWSVYSNTAIYENLTNKSSSNGHGTHVSGIVALCTPDNVKIEALGVTNSLGETSNVRLEAALKRAIEDNVDVINLSLGGKYTGADVGGEDYSDDVIDEVLKKAYDQGISICAAAGNDSDDAHDYYPARSKYVFCVSSVGKNTDITKSGLFAFSNTFSNYDKIGLLESVIDFAAPGEKVTSYDYLSNKARLTKATKSGTSMATPFISASCAIVKSVYKDMYDTSPVFVKDTLKKICVQTDEPYKLGNGIPVFSRTLEIPDGILPTITPKASTEASPTTSPTASASPTLVPSISPTPSVAPTPNNESEQTLSLKEAERVIATQKNDSDIKGSRYSQLQAKMLYVSDKKIKIKWKRQKNADGYIIYGNKCGSKNKYKKYKIIKNNNTLSYTKNKLKKNTYYKFIVLAYQGKGENRKILTVSKTLHIVTKGSKYANVSSVVIQPKSMNMAVNTRKRVKTKEVIAQNKISKKHRKMSFESTDSSIATVTKKGYVTAKKKGECKIFAYAQNGCCKSFTVKVD